MRPKLVVGNWKMHGSRGMTRDLAGALAQRLAALAGVEIAVCPPFVYLEAAAQALAGSGIALGAQNLAVADAGAFTGEVSAGMLLDLGCRYVIVGHSERRSLLGEDDATVGAKAHRARSEGLVAIVCVGETLAQRQAGDTLAVIDRQLDAVLAAGPVGCAGLVLAYEPVWAIGTGETASPEQAQAVHAHLRGRLLRQFGGAAETLPLLYGGSVKPDNAAALFGCEDIDGGLIGGAALDAEAFASICEAAAGSR